MPNPKKNTNIDYSKQNNTTINFLNNQNDSYPTNSNELVGGINQEWEIINKQDIYLNQFSSFLNYYSIPRGKDCQFIFKLRKHLLFLDRLARTEDSYRLPRISSPDCNHGLGSVSLN